MTAPGYSRPALDIAQYRDEHGDVIPYGSRWDRLPYDGSPPDWAYSQCPHPERFAPLWTVADAVVAFLSEAYLVDVVQRTGVDPELPAVARRHLETRLRTAALTATTTVLVPRGPGATLAVMRTEDERGFPGLFVFAGDAFEHNAVGCGCDACDDRVEDLADDLERVCFDVAQGYFFERWDRRGLTVGRHRPQVGGEWSTTPRGQVDRDVRRTVKASMRHRPDGVWPAWL